MNDRSGTAAILMATWNGAAFLDEQLRSIADQSHPLVDVWVSDDGSTDDTPAILADWQLRWSKGRFEILKGPQKGFSENFRSLITNAEIDADYFAFSDQDDIWETVKLEKAIDWMKSRRESTPLLFCSRTLNVTASGATMGFSPLFAKEPSFRNALVQSLAGGNTMLLNRSARNKLSEASLRSNFVSHDWWAYLVISGSGGEVCYSSTPFVRYRQHGGNQVGANTSWRARQLRLRLLLRGQFLRWTDINLKGLECNRDLLTQDAVASTDKFAQSRQGSLLYRVRNLRRSGVYRQTLGGTVMLWAATVFGWI